MGNGAIATNTNTQNGKHVDIAITVRGSDWYWAVCAVMTAASIAFIGLALTKPRQHRIFHYITAGVTLTAAIAYFTMASNLGWTPIDVEYRRSASIVSGVNREIFYVRYIDWFVTTPLLLMDLLLTAAMPWPTILFVVLVDEFMIITGLVGALVKSSYKWGYFVFAMVALGYIVFNLVWDARIHANRLGKDVGRAFLYCGVLTAFLWCLYPIAWAVSEGGNVIAPDSEAVFYGILDLLAKPVFGALLIWGHRNIDPARLGLHLIDYTGEDYVVNGNGKGGNGISGNGVHGNGSGHELANVQNGQHGENNQHGSAVHHATTDGETV